MDNPAFHFIMNKSASIVRNFLILILELNDNRDGIIYR